MATWKLDPNHSEVKFKVKHLVVSTIAGNFNTYSATVDSSKEDFSDAKITFEAVVDSLDTKNAQRDGHLKSADFFDAANHPAITFTSKSFRKKSGNEYELSGDLTVRGTTKEVSLAVEYNGTVKGFGGSYDVAAFEITGKINRKEFGLNWSALTETGGIVVGDDVKIEVLAEFVKA
ncbi:YceI family protein [Chryseolinea lacunae]|uniref:YceI family protein n=1 Tax=Chryseolinea lacunae TaxID=2801331 RepID=A0ABS1KSY0_9BACT|nr:YceI family protein [Chryseolinea lacunae]MBL0742578.1 YceI family protein [Chryseolinea lacunae]